MKPRNNPTPTHCFRNAPKAFLTAAAGIILMAGCSTTKRIPEGEQLYTGVKNISVNAPKGDKVPEGVASEVT